MLYKSIYILCERFILVKLESAEYKTCVEMGNLLDSSYYFKLKEFEEQKFTIFSKYSSHYELPNDDLNEVRQALRSPSQKITSFSNIWVLWVLSTYNRFEAKALKDANK